MEYYTFQGGSMKLLFFSVAITLAMGSALAQPDTVFIDSGTQVKSFLTSQVDSITFYRWPDKLTKINESSRENTNPTRFDISQNFPNPFNPTTHLNCSIPSAGKVQARIYNVNGALIKEIFTGEKEPGEYFFLWDGKNNSGVHVASGTYLFSVRFNNLQLTRKIIYLK